MKRWSYPRSRCARWPLRWVAVGVFERLGTEARAAYDRIIEFAPDIVAVDGSIHKTPFGGEGTGKGPPQVQRRRTSVTNRLLPRRGRIHCIQRQRHLDQLLQIGPASATIVTTHELRRSAHSIHRIHCHHGAYSTRGKLFDRSDESRADRTKTVGCCNRFGNQHEIIQTFQTPDRSCVGTLTRRLLEGRS